jgi:hypothetical protein
MSGETWFSKSRRAVIRKGKFVFVHRRTQLAREGFPSGKAEDYEFAGQAIRTARAGSARVRVLKPT